MSSTEKLTPSGRAKARVRDRLRDNYLKNGLITRDEYDLARFALNTYHKQMKNMERAA